MSFDVYAHNGELVDPLLKLGFDVTPNPKFARGSGAVIAPAIKDFAKQDIDFAELESRIGDEVIIHAVHYHGGTDFTYDVHFRKEDDDFSNLPEYCLRYPTDRNATLKQAFDPASEDSDVEGTLDSIVQLFQKVFPQELVSGSGILSSHLADIYITVGNDVIHWTYHLYSAEHERYESEVIVNKDHVGAFDPYDAGIGEQLLPLYQEWKKKQHLLDWAFSPPPRGPYRPSSSLKLTFEVDPTFSIGQKVLVRYPSEKEVYDVIDLSDFNHTLEDRHHIVVDLLVGARGVITNVKGKPPDVVIYMIRFEQSYVNKLFSAVDLRWISSEYVFPLNPRHAFEVDHFDTFKKYVIDYLQESTREGLLRPHAFTVLKEQVEKCEDVACIKDVITTGLDEEMFLWILNNYLSHPPLTTSLKLAFETNHFLNLREYIAERLQDVIKDLSTEPDLESRNTIDVMNKILTDLPACNDVHMVMSTFEKHMDGDFFLGLLNDWLGIP